MPNAHGHLTNQDVRRICELTEAGVRPSQVAEIVGVSPSTVRKLCPVVMMRARALRYTAFVERAAAYAPLLVTPSPF
jgi:DNA-binding CsgD family transcriptional regulator